MSGPISQATRARQSITMSDILNAREGLCGPARGLQDSDIEVTCNACGESMRLNECSQVSRTHILYSCRKCGNKLAAVQIAAELEPSWLYRGTKCGEYALCNGVDMILNFSFGPLPYPALYNSPQKLVHRLATGSVDSNRLQPMHASKEERASVVSGSPVVAGGLKGLFPVIYPAGVQSGFTLLGPLIAIAIVGVVAAAILPVLPNLIGQLFHNM